MNESFESLGYRQMGGFCYASLCVEPSDDVRWPVASLARRDVTGHSDGFIDSLPSCLLGHILNMCELAAFVLAALRASMRIRADVLNGDAAMVKAFNSKRRHAVVMAVLEPFLNFDGSQSFQSRGFGKVLPPPFDCFSPETGWQALVTEFPDGETESKGLGDWLCQYNPAQEPRTRMQVSTSFLNTAREGWWLTKRAVFNRFDISLDGSARTRLAVGHYGGETVLYKMKMDDDSALRGECKWTPNSQRIEVKWVSDPPGSTVDLNFLSMKSIVQKDGQVFWDRDDVSEGYKLKYVSWETEVDGIVTLSDGTSFLNPAVVDRAGKIEIKELYTVMDWTKDHWGGCLCEDDPEIKPPLVCGDANQGFTSPEFKISPRNNLRHGPGFQILKMHPDGVHCKLQFQLPPKKWFHAAAEHYTHVNMTLRWDYEGIEAGKMTSRSGHDVTPDNGEMAGAELDAWRFLIHGDDSEDEDADEAD